VAGACDSSWSYSIRTWRYFTPSGLGSLTKIHKFCRNQFSIFISPPTNFRFHITVPAWSSFSWALLLRRPMQEGHQLATCPAYSEILIDLPSQIISTRSCISSVSSTEDMKMDGTSLSFRFLRPGSPAGSNCRQRPKMRLPKWVKYTEGNSANMSGKKFARRTAQTHFTLWERFARGKWRTDVQGPGSDLSLQSQTTHVEFCPHGRQRKVSEAEEIYANCMHLSVTARPADLNDVTKNDVTMSENLNSAYLTNGASYALETGTIRFSSSIPTTYQK
jgi:hypothetical protein